MGRRWEDASPAPPGLRAAAVLEAIGRLVAVHRGVAVWVGKAPMQVEAFGKGMVWLLERPPRPRLVVISAEEVVKVRVAERPGRIG